MLAIIDYDAGNLTSVDLAVKHVGGDAVVTKDPEIIKKADRVIFPGVGAASSCMQNLKNYKLDLAIKDCISSGKPILVICIGIQLLFDRTEEDGGVDCLGIVPGIVKKFDFTQTEKQKVPHMGWNEAKVLKKHPVLAEIKDGDEFYFVHSYYPVVSDESICLMETEYGNIKFTSGIARENIIATQFHPEKSGKAGLSILKNFLSWNA